MQITQIKDTLLSTFQIPWIPPSASSNNIIKFPLKITLIFLIDPIQPLRNERNFDKSCADTDKIFKRQVHRRRGGGEGNEDGGGEWKEEESRTYRAEIMGSGGGGGWSSRNFFHARITLSTLRSDALNNGDKGECRGNITIIARMMDNDRGGCLSRPFPSPYQRPLFNWIQCYADHYGIDFENFLSGIRLVGQTLLPPRGLTRNGL